MLAPISEPELTARVRALIDYIGERPVGLDDLDDGDGLALRLDLVTAGMTQVDVVFDDAEYPEPPPNKDLYSTTAKRMQVRFPYLGAYNAVSSSMTDNIGTAELGVGDAIDDIADIVIDLGEYLWRLEHTSTADALWHLEFTYRNHWGVHARWLQLYLANLRFGW